MAEDMHNEVGDGHLNEVLVTLAMEIDNLRQDLEQIRTDLRELRGYVTLQGEAIKEMGARKLQSVPEINRAPLGRAANGQPIAWRDPALDQ